MTTFLSSHNTPLVAPGVFDGLSARLVQQAGFQAVYASGGAISRSCGYPDIGLLSFSEVCQQLEYIVNAVDIPVIADADTGFGNSNNVKRTIETFENIGVAALHIEDQAYPKRCGHLEGKQLIGEADMCDKIATATSARKNSELLIIARTDAIAVEDFDAAIARAKAYVKAGADMIFVEAPQTVEQIESIAKQISAPKLINMFYGGKTPLVPVEQLATWDYQIIIIPSDLQRAAIFAMQKTLASIKQHGDSSSIKEQLTSFDEREKIIGTDSYL
ncbi:MAG: oxaloacetate decarboxylase [Gammaproteobacteria bacterium]|nr:oxaloacetate decarboxylase [Gammaproteobacteria bacterium]